MNRLKTLFENKKQDILNIYFTAGYPMLEDMPAIVAALESAGTDLIEIGMPYSDPLADGPTIQDSSTQALKNGMTLPLLFEQVTNLRKHTKLPIILMGYFNQMMQYGEQAFIEQCKTAGVDGLILPDLPLDVYEADYKTLFEANDIRISFLITPQTSDDRIRKVDELTSSFIYMVSQAAITGAKSGITDAQKKYFDRINNMELKNPRLIGFGISSNETFTTACQYASGAIIGSAFIRSLKQNGASPAAIQGFVKEILGKVDSIV